MEKLENAKELQNIENIQRFNKRLVKVTRKHNDDCKRLLQLLGVPVIQAPSEAEAQCAQLCREGLVYAAATEDMDALTLGCPRLIRNLTSANAEKIKEYQIEKVLDGLGINQEQFIDLSILMGCDYCDNIRGIGGKKGLELIRKFNNIETILKEKFDITEFVAFEIEYNTRRSEMKTEDNSEENGDKNSKVKAENEEEEAVVKSEDKDEESDVKNEENGDLVEVKEENNGDEKLDESFEFKEEVKEEDEVEEHEGKSKDKSKRQVVPDNWPFLGARKLFQEPLVVKGEFTESSLKPKEIDEEGLIQFLCTENGFSEDRVKNAIKRAKESKNKSSQTRIDTFFKMLPQSKSPAATKRNAPDVGKKTSNKRGRKAR